MEKKTGRGKNPNSLKNLRPPTAEECRKGAFASNKKQREVRDLRKTVEQIINMPVRSGKTETMTHLGQAKTKNLTVIEAVVAAQVKRALTGDTRAFTALKDIIMNQLNINIETDKGIESLLDKIKGREVDGA